VETLLKNAFVYVPFVESVTSASVLYLMPQPVDDSRIIALLIFD